MHPNQFNTITGSDWRVSLIAARTRRTINEIKFQNQITDAMKLAPRSQSRMRQKCGAEMREAHASKKESALDAMRRGYSAGWCARWLDAPYNLMTTWRDEAGIAKCNPGKGRPTPAVGEVLK